LIQVLAALPWLSLVFLKREDIAVSLGNLRNTLQHGGWWARALVRRLLVVVVAVFVLPVVIAAAAGSSKTLEALGYSYAVILQLQRLADGFILIFALMLSLWPKGGAIALAAFREGVRQPMFWLLFGVAFVAMSVSPLIPYFTFGEDHLVVKEIGIDTI